MDTSRSPLFAPVCDRLRSLFEPTTQHPAPNDLDRLLDALDDAYLRGDLFNGGQE